MKKRFSLVFVLPLIFCAVTTYAQKRPKLIVGIVVDQMRYDYLEKFYNDFGEGGFQRLVEEGFNCKNVNYNYKPTYTGPGHASIFTGTTPSVHGIVGNNWYAREENRQVYCVDYLENNELVKSPQRLLSETFADGVKHFFNHRSKTYGISLKDRGAILPAGHMANGAYWFNSKTGAWESSQYYPNSAPEWLVQFNAKDFRKEYLSKKWTLSLEESQYMESAPDQNNFERAFIKDGSIVFPYDLEQLQEEKGWGVLKTIPQGNQMTVDLACHLIESENLGKDDQTDFLSVSFSATDYVGHQFGTQSMEVHDTYIKLDRTLSGFLQFLEEKVGKGDFLLFLTSDHGASMPRNYLKANHLPHGHIDEQKMQDGLEDQLDKQFGEQNWVLNVMNLNVYLNHKLLQQEEVRHKWSAIMDYTATYLEQQEGIAMVIEKRVEKNNNSSVVNRTMLGIHPSRSGDLVMIEHPNWTTYSDKGSTHGSPYQYDTHVPLLYYGFGIKNGETDRAYDITSIISTVSAISHIPFNSTNASESIQELAP